MKIPFYHKWKEIWKVINENKHTHLNDFHESILCFAYIVSGEKGNMKIHIIGSHSICWLHTVVRNYVNWENIIIKLRSLQCTCCITSVLHFLLKFQFSSVAWFSSQVILPVKHYVFISVSCFWYKNSR